MALSSPQLSLELLLIVVKLNEALPPETWERADQIVATYDDWYNNTATVGQKIIADQTIGPIVEAIGAAVVFDVNPVPPIVIV
mgnify:CR=1 FL=1